MQGKCKEIPGLFGQLESIGVYRNMENQMEKIRTIEWKL